MGRPINDLTGQKFGKLLVVDRAGTNEYRNPTWNYICDCGKKGVVTTKRLTDKSNPMKHCGCLTSQHCSGRKGIKSGSYKHGLSNTLEYWIEHSAKRKIKKQKNNAGSNISYAESLKIARPKLDYCVYCGSTDTPSIDHIIPIDKGGTQDPKNLIRACAFCNSSKRNLFFIDWYIKTKRNLRSLSEIISDMGFDSINHLQNYQNVMCLDYVEENHPTVFAKLLRAERKSIRSLDRYYRSLDHYPTH